MGQKLSCVSRNQPIEGVEKKSKKPKCQMVATGGDQINAESANQQESAVSEKVIFLEPAPSSFSLPSTIPACKKAKDGTHIQANPEVTAISKRPGNEMVNSADRVHKEQPVDGEARRLAQGKAKPACWRDLYWHLVYSRGFKTDEEKVRALFTWICSTSPDMQPFPSEVEEDDAHKVKGKGKHQIDSPDVVLPRLVKGKANYAFESMLRYSGIPCVTVRGIAKSMDYKVGQPLVQKEEPLFHPETGALPAQIASLQHSWNAAYVDGLWRLYDCTWAAQRLAMGTREGLPKSSQAVTLQYETDMFYYQVDPTKLIYTHYPFEDVWQLIDPPVSIVSFATWPLLKPAFFQYGLHLFSHQEGVVAVENQLVLKLKILPENITKLLFTYQLNLEGFGNIDVGSSKTRFGMHEIAPEESCVIFRFRLPKKGDYNLVIYARHSGEQLFSDVCEYRVTARGKEGEGGSLSALPFPPTAQANYGPTEKASEYGLETLPRGLPPLIKSPKGTVEIRFVAAEIENRIPRLTARLKSLSVKPELLENCILLRDIEASVPTTGVSVLTGTGPCVPMSVLNAYLPEPGEYALEVYAAPSDSDEPTAYHLAWQFLIEAEAGKPLSAPLLSRLATINLGPQDNTWQNLGFRTLSHPDPLVRVRTAGRTGSERLLRLKNKSQILQRFMGSQGIHSQQAEATEPGKEPSQPIETNPEEEQGSRPVDREACDLQIILGLPEQQKVCLISQLVDISGDEEEDVTGYLLQKANALEDEEPQPGDRSSTLSRDIPSQVVNLLIRIPKGGSFYKLYLYAVPMEQNITGSIPLVFTYLIDAPLRLSAAEAPYIGATAGEFPEKIEKREAAEEAAAAKGHR
ncbi:Kyphoscoliosis peptidase [Echinococcus granulosus]|uniref:Ubiquitin protein ligase BRE1 n=1 Tax=Echinococcus granulosus TaxID=6210 RepID=A0A068WE99_ECHGR|nr:Kyphoscoliosis peptidase [Echinococcus granulosus]CDS15952.1 ubiquitin protein ligase BRE1 [Echinococcus granulosus]